MRASTEDQAQRDAVLIAGAVSIIVLIVVFTFTSGFFFRYIVIMDIILAFTAGYIGSQRRIGFSAAFFLALFLSPFVGFALAFTSPKTVDEEYQKKILEATSAMSSSSIADELQKLNELRKEGVLTDEEFDSQKARLLGQ